MMEMWAKLSGSRTNLGIVAWGLVALIVQWSDTVTATTPWVITAQTMIGAWTGLGAAAKVDKLIKAKK